VSSYEPPTEKQEQYARRLGATDEQIADAATKRQMSLLLEELIAGREAGLPPPSAVKPRTSDEEHWKGVLTKFINEAGGLDKAMERLSDPADDWAAWEMRALGKEWQDARPVEYDSAPDESDEMKLYVEATVVMEERERTAKAKGEAERAERAAEVERIKAIPPPVFDAEGYAWRKAAEVPDEGTHFDSEMYDPWPEN